MYGEIRSLKVRGFPDDAQKVFPCALPDPPSTDSLSAVKITVAQAQYELWRSQHEGNPMSDTTLIILVVVLLFLFGGGGGYYYYRGRG
jgi:hypothetical protein